MSSRTIRLVEPIPWQPDLVGEYPGQLSVMHLGKARMPSHFCWCPPTSPGQPAMLGSPPTESGRDGDDQDLHPVHFPRGFWLAQHPVSQAQWRAVIGGNPSRFKGDDRPVDSVSWDDAQKFCQKTGLRLPRETEWEYACRAGSTTPFGTGSGTSLNAQMANFDGTEAYGEGKDSFKWLYREKTTPAASFPPNAWGFHDMHGQLWEWCEDAFNASARVLRGGSWFDSGRYARSAIRFGSSPGNRFSGFGFRPSPSSISPGPEAIAEQSKE
jgi:formylglycine-generating enzyme required for sulfatase activity